MSQTIQVLVVEDSLTQAMRLRHVLEKDGYSVTVTGNGVEALAAIEQSLPSLIISDVVMPEMDGYELCRRVKTDERWKDIPVVLLTSLAEPDDVFGAMQAGADNFISKPYDDRFLLTNLKRIISNMELRKERGIDLGIEVYFAGHKFFLNSSRIQIIDFLLSTYESALHKNQELDKQNKQMEEALESIKILQSNYRQLLDTNADAVVVVDADGIVRYANPAAHQLITCSSTQLIGSTLPFPVVAGDRREVELSTQHGDIAVAEMRVVATNWDGECVNLAVLRDITEHVHMREELRHLSLRDELTLLYNRRGFSLLAEQMLQVAQRERQALFLLYIDLDGFKGINDTLGHQEGDLALRDIAELLGQTFRKSDIIGRMGGDEFAVLGLVSDEQYPEAMANRLQEAIVTHNATGGRAFHLAASLGIVHCCPPQDCPDLAALIERADACMYEAKRAKQR